MFDGVSLGCPTSSSYQTCFPSPTSCHGSPTGTSNLLSRNCCRGEKGGGRKQRFRSDCGRRLEVRFSSTCNLVCTVSSLESMSNARGLNNQERSPMDQGQLDTKLSLFSTSIRLSDLFIFLKGWGILHLCAPASSLEHLSAEKALHSPPRMVRARMLLLAGVTTV